MEVFGTLQIWGCYLDIDSKFNNSINNFVNNNDEALISAEKNPDNYVQWALFYKKEHPILMRTVELIISNIKKGLFKNNIESLTGPKIYAESVKEYYKFSTNKELNWSSINSDTNITFEFKKNNKIHKARLFSIDYKDNLKFKHKHSHLLYDKSDHWLKTQGLVLFINLRYLNLEGILLFSNHKIQILKIQLFVNFKSNT